MDIDIGWQHASSGRQPLSREETISIGIDYEDYISGYQEYLDSLVDQDDDYPLKD